MAKVAEHKKEQQKLAERERWKKDRDARKKLKV